MTRQKIWTRAAARRRSEQAAAAAADWSATHTALQQRARTRRSRNLKLAAAGLSFAGLTVFALTAFDKQSTATVIFALAFAAAAVGGVAGYFVLRRPLGKLTAVAALALITGVLMLAGSAISPQCPGSDTAGRCGTDDLVNWGMVGLLVPVVAWAFVGVPVIIVRFCYRTGRWVFRLAQTARSGETAPPARKSDRRSLPDRFQKVRVQPDTAGKKRSTRG